MDARLIPLSALQHYAFCPRQCALIHNEQLWEENFLTAQGKVLHERVDKGGPESRKGIRMERGVSVSAPQLGLTGKLDLLEKDLSTGQLTPVEYKRGRPKKGDFDAVQLCAQALCLEEMTGQQITQGALWYWQTRHRQVILLDQPLRERTRDVIAKVAEIFHSGVTPKAKYGKYCTACSLIDQCNPKLSERDHSANYLESLFNDSETDASLTEEEDN